MENSYFRSPWNPNPIRHGRFFHESPKQQQQQQSRPKVISVPVRFVESVAESKRKDSAAVKIQRTFRGFLVRKNVATVRRIEREVDEIERRIRREEALIRRDAKERLRTNEMLMAVLLRLDSVRGVRDYRRKVIRRVISLQEAVDSIAAAEGSEALENHRESEEDDDRETLDVPGSRAEEGKGLSVEEKTLDVLYSNAEEAKESVKEEEEATMEDREIPESRSAEEDKKGNCVEETMEDQGETTLGIPESRTVQEQSEDDETPVKEIGVDEKASPMEEEQEEEGIGEEWSMVEAPEETPESRPKERMESSAKVSLSSELEKSKDPGLKGVMERMVAENEKLKGLVAVLCERSAEQCRLMGGLAKRVEHLEKMVQMMEKRKKKKMREANNTTGLEKKGGL